MTREEFKKLLAERVAEEFSGGKRRSDGVVRPALDPIDCDFIADLVFSEIGQSGLCLGDANRDRIQDP